MKTVYEADGTPVTLNPIDARERIKVGLAFEKPNDSVVWPQTAIVTGDGTGEVLPNLPASAYAPNGAPLVESERPVLSLRRGRPPKADEGDKA